MAVRPMVDRNVCDGHALCTIYAPAVFEVDADERAVVTDPDVGEELLPDVQLAVDQCPTQAIRLEGV